MGTFLITIQPQVQSPYQPDFLTHHDNSGRKNPQGNLKRDETKIKNRVEEKKTLSGKDESMTRDERYAEEGWTKKFTCDASRVDEFVEMYKS
ncbi:MAG: hypothetical protein DSY91_05320, partial [Deltaproteobacteria bacterium]